MKKICLHGLLSFFLLAVTATVYSQEYPNEGMPLRDSDGNVHRIIMTESGVWMAENLKSMKFNDGTPIPFVRNNADWKKTKTPAYGYYKSEVSYSETYGAIYNWHAVNSGKLCPVGWHVPTREEWEDLLDYAGGGQKSGDNPAKLKETGTSHWKSPNEGATNELYFTALPAGGVSFSREDPEPGTKTVWWTSTEDRLNMEPGTKEIPTNAEIVGLSYNFHSKTMGTYPKEAALPVRCKMDD